MSSWWHGLVCVLMATVVRSASACMGLLLCQLSWTAVCVSSLCQQSVSAVYVSSLYQQSGGEVICVPVGVDVRWRGSNASD